MYIRLIMVTLLALTSMSSLAKGFDENYEVLQGDFDGDGDIDLYVRQKPQVILIHGDIITPVVLSPDVEEFILVHDSSDSSMHLESDLSGYNLELAQNSTVNVTLGDFNADGYVDIKLVGINNVISYVLDQLILANGIPNTPPFYVRSVDGYYQSFFEEAYESIKNPNFFEENAPLKKVLVDQEWKLIGASIVLTCSFNSCYRDIFGRWVYWDSFFGMERDVPECIFNACSVVSGVLVELIYGWVPEYEMRPDYSVFNQDAMEFANQWTIVKDAPTIVIRIPAVREVLRRVLEVIGWDGAEDVLSEGTVPVTNKEILQTVIVLIENICGIKSADECIGVWEDIVNSGYILETEVNHEYDDIDSWGKIIASVKTAEQKRRKSKTRYHCTYIKVNSNNKKYYGRTTARENESCVDAVFRRDQAHKRNTVRFNSSWEDANLDRSANGTGGYSSIRGREQQLIDSHVWSDGVVEGIESPNVHNLIRGVAKKNPLGCVYWLASAGNFPPSIGPYTGDTSIEACDQL